MFYSAFLKAEWTAGNAVLLGLYESSAVIELQSQVFVYSHPHNTIQEKVLLECIVANRFLIDGFTLKKKAILYDRNFKKIGKCIAELVPYKVSSLNDTSSIVSVIALIDKASLDPVSVPERALAQLMQSAGINVKSNFFKQYFLQYGFKKQDSIKAYEPYVFQEFDFEKHQFVPRLMLVFLHDELIAVFHTRALQLPIYDASEQGYGFGMIYNSKFNEHDKSTLMEVYKLGLQSSK
jgi:hypothetical protein